MLSSLHNRFSVATDTKFGAIPPTFPLKAEDKEPAELTNDEEPDFLLTVDDLTDMETIEDVVEEIADNVVENITQCEVLPESKEMEDEIFETFPVLNEQLFVDLAVEPAVLDEIIAEKVVENITISITQSEVPEPPELKETEDEVIEKIPPVSNNPLFVEPAEFVLDDIYTNYDDDNFEEQKPAKKKRGVLKTFLNEFKPTYRKKLKKSKSII